MRLQELGRANNVEDSQVMVEMPASSKVPESVADANEYDH